MTTQRDSSIDILRAIAFLGLVAAHVKPSEFIFQLRNFDVPMMVFLSGVVYSLKSKQETSYFSYVIKRFVRIIIPTWIFLFIYNMCITHESLIYTISQFDLMTDWYVWIMRVFFIIALIAPFVGTVSKRLNISSFFTLLIVLLLLNELLCHQSWAQGSSAETSIILLMNLAYILVFSFGFFIQKMSTNQIICVLIISTFVFSVFGAYLWHSMGFFVQTQMYKYPPSLYYLSYAFIWICALWLSRKYIQKMMIFFHLNRILKFMGSHTMWIYFWHIVVLYYIEDINSSILKYLIVVFLSSIATYIQHMVVAAVSKHLSPSTDKYARMIFDG